MMKPELGKTWLDYVGRKFYMDSVSLPDGRKTRSGDVRLIGVFLRNLSPDKSLIKRAHGIKCEKTEAAKLSKLMVPVEHDRLMVYWETNPRHYSVMSVSVCEQLMSAMQAWPTGLAASDFKYKAGEASKDTVKKEVQTAPKQIVDSPQSV